MFIYDIISNIYISVALVAQLVEYIHGKDGVIGSNPIEGLDWLV